ncbi:HdeD family acid-resistance protein [Cryobacterium roopkundense]|uniref:Uncharacterized membrane protein HdeD (DUF308 family) n=1 Tax=Cryobacterium roopkundense TaxID=1001240 RepID=A0A7W9E5E0_9MICO|nr:hypothetical protein [Cryobacterium roopkundense]MBB5643101.1 uncharacterized membrane protein HdeD (DUF308 family) [Cryobacterium roopkundense]
MANAQSASAGGKRFTGERSSGERYWTVPIARAAIAVVPGAVITFNRDHSAAFGLLTFGAFALASGLLLAVLSSLTLADGRARRLFLIQGVVGVVAGALALAFHAGGLGFFLYLVSVWGAVTGFLELYSGSRVRGRLPVAKDWMLVGALTAVLALLFLLLPPNTVVAVGLLGAYLAVFAMYLVIAGLSLKWAKMDAPASAAPVANDSDSQ